MIDVLLTAAVIAAAGWLGYEIGRSVGHEEAQAGKYARRRLAGR